jgi:hypothetical protein
VGCPSALTCDTFLITLCGIPVRAASPPIRDSQTDSQQDKQQYISVHHGKLVMSQNPEIFDIRG